MNDIKEHLTWNVQDSTKLQAFVSCPRSYFFEYVLGWRKKEPNVHLEFGTCAHLAMEYLLTNGEPLTSDGRKVQYKGEDVLEAYNLFEKEYRKTFPVEQDELNEPKTPANFLRLLVQYVEKYANYDDFIVLYTEVSGCIIINKEGRVLYVKMDSVCKANGGIFSLEHKTGTRISRQWTDQWRQKIQTGAYTHALHCLFPGEEIYGVYINGLFVHNPPALKADGTPKANAKDNEFLRIPIRKTLPMMDDWLYYVNYWYDMLEWEFEKLQGCSDEDVCMKCFPKNTESCTKYFGCPYSDYCNSWVNPLQHLESMPIEFKVDFWDPRTMLETAKKIIQP